MCTALNTWACLFFYAYILDTSCVYESIFNNRSLCKRSAFCASFACFIFLPSFERSVVLCPHLPVCLLAFLFVLLSFMGSVLWYLIFTCYSMLKIMIDGDTCLCAEYCDNGVVHTFRACTPTFGLHVATALVSTVSRRNGDESWWYHSDTEPCCTNVRYRGTVVVPY